MPPVNSRQPGIIGIIFPTVGPLALSRSVSALDSVLLREAPKLLIKESDVGWRGLTEAGAGMLADYWYWIFKAPTTGLRRSTGRRLRRVEAQEVPVAQPVPGTLQREGSDIDFDDTEPLVFHSGVTNSEVQ